MSAMIFAIALSLFDTVIRLAAALTGGIALATA